MSTEKHAVVENVANRKTNPRAHVTAAILAYQDCCFSGRLRFIGLVYGVADGRFFPENTRVGFKHGVVHGALMPMALPSLLMGKDVKIYDENNDGRNYKLGY